jgi:tetratricopeptide (TPR) repeat protein
MPEIEREYAFLSYAHEDLEKVRKVYKGLKERNVNVWFDKEDMKKGRWKPQILKAISRSRDFVICLSNAAIKKTRGEKPGFQDEELQIAWEFAREQDERGITIVPVRLEDCSRGDMRLSGWQQYDLFEDWEGVLDTLAVNIRGVSLADATAKDERTEDEKMVEGLMGKAEIFYYSGEYDKALSFVEYALELKPDFHEAWNNKGLALGKSGRHEEALKAFDKAIELEPDDHGAWSNKGLALADLGRHEEALKAYNKALELKPDFHEAWYNKRIALRKSGRKNEAQKTFEKYNELKKKLKK